MKRNIVLAAFIGVLSFAGITAGQATADPRPRIEPVSHQIEVHMHVIVNRSSSSANETVVYGYRGIESPNAQFYEADIRASTPDACIGTTDFSTAVPVGPERASLTFDRETGVNNLQWSLATSGSGGCRVLLVRSADGSDDYNIFRGHYKIVDPVTGRPQTIEFTTKKATNLGTF